MNGSAGLKGAASGAAMGSVAGPWGAVAGGVIGGAMGLFSGDDTQDKFQAVNPYSSDVLADALANNKQVYQQQQDLADALVARSQGQGPNPALDQLHQTTDQNGQTAASLVASQRGLNPALAARMALNAKTTADQQAGGQAATLAAQQALGAQSELAGLYNNEGNQNIQQQSLYNTAQSGADKINSGVSSENTATNVKQVGGMEQGAGAIAAMAMKSPSSTTTPQIAGQNGAPASTAMATGGRVPGRARVAGDSKTNDIVPAQLSPGEIVIPRSHADNAKDAKDFIDHLMSRPVKKKGQPGGYAAVLAAHRRLGQALEGVNS